MARTKKELPFQDELHNETQWQTFLDKEGLGVVDVFQEWAGPCKMIQPYFRRWRNEIGNPKLNFGVAKCNYIPVLAGFIGKCKPVFMFFASGFIVGIVRGADPPKLYRTLVAQLDKEMNLLELDQDPELEGEKAPRDLITVPEFELLKAKGSGLTRHDTILTWGSNLTAGDLAGIVPEAMVLVCVIKPDVMEEKPAIIAKIQEAGIDILDAIEQNLTEQEVGMLYPTRRDELSFPELVELMMSGPCALLILASSNDEFVIYDYFREILGPKKVADAKKNEPSTLRGIYGTDDIKNGVDATTDSDETKLALNVFFPSFQMPEKFLYTQSHLAIGLTEPDVTLALILHEAMRLKDEIISRIRSTGFEILVHNDLNLPREVAAEFYSSQKDSENFEQLVDELTGPLVALVLAKRRAVESWKKVMGPKEFPDLESKEQARRTFRGKLKLDENMDNTLHGSENREAAKAELEFFFPTNKTLAAIKPDGMLHKNALLEKINEAGFEVTKSVELTLTQQTAEMFYEKRQHVEYYQELIEHATSGPMLFMELQKQDAVYDWRQMMGPTHPEDAKLLQVSSIRAEYGSTVVHNTVHGSANSAEAFKNLLLIFYSYPPAQEAVATPEPSET